MRATQFRLFALIILLVAFVACTDYDHDTPDTAANLAGFERHFGFAAPPDEVTAQVNLWGALLLKLGARLAAWRQLQVAGTV